MRGSSLRKLTTTLVISLLLWSSILGVCNGRRGRHWRSVSSSLAQNKGKSYVGHSHSHSHSYHHSGVATPKLSPPPYITPAPVVSPPSPPPPPLVVPSPPSTSVSTFNVMDFGAVGDGKSDDTKAFEAAWGEACKLEASTMVVPSGYRFLVGPISLSGPYCMPNIVFQLDGTIIAPTRWTIWGSNGMLWWIQFTKLKGLTIQGSGTIDGSGSIWWQHSLDNDDETELLVSLHKTPPNPITTELGWRVPSIKPTAVRFYGSSNVTVMGITIQNSPQCHLKFDDCVGVTVHDVNISSPGDSPNTDGIHLQNSQEVNIHNTHVACGDDCVSIQTGCSNVYIHTLNCGPGHGISIGSLGKGNTKACVSNITVRDVVLQNTLTGVRIKTWQGGLGSVKNVLFSNILMKQVQLPIVIDQFYCDGGTCRNESSAVAVSGVTYEGIRGSYTMKPVHLACSDDVPCTEVIMRGIELEAVQEGYRLSEPFCWETFGEMREPSVPPIDCLKVGKPGRSGVQSEYDVC